MTLSLAPRSGSATATPANGETGAVPLPPCWATRPVTVAGSFTAVTVTTVSGACAPAPALASTVRIVVATVAPGVVWCAVGVNTTPSSAMLVPEGVSADST